MPKQNGSRTGLENAIRYGEGPYGRHDRESRGSIHVFSRPDGSIVVCVTSVDQTSRRVVRAQCAVTVGESPATYEALLGLMVAMENDNGQSPQPQDVKEGERTVSL